MGKTIGNSLLLVAAALAGACGGDDDGEPNSAPTANAGNDRTVVELSSVTLAGMGSDPDGDTLSFSWTQTSGPAVTLNNASTASADFTAPDVTAGNPQVLMFRLTATDQAGLSDTDDVSVTVQEPGAVVTISGVMAYEFPPPNNACQGLNFSNVQLRPIRQATVQALNAAGTVVLDSAVTDDLGNYSVTVNASTDVMLRVRAELKNGSPSWDVEVRNNVDTSMSPLPLAQRPLYVLDSAVMDSGVVDQTVDLTATTGWGVTSYTGPRAAAPFAVLDTIYAAMQFVLATDSGATFAPLDAFWSPDNTTTEGSGTFDERVASGEIGTSFYTSNMLFLLGKDGDDAEEFDDHVIIHEWGHYFEDNFSRADNIGGAHGVGDLLDARVAFGEGWATALSGMALDNPLYCDTLWSGGVLTGFDINIESENGGTAGWFNEVSVLKLLYDLWDTDNDGADNSSIGFLPIYDTLTGPQVFTPAFTTIFSFGTELKSSLNAQDQAFVDALLAAHGIVGNNIDIWGSTETNDGPGSPPDVLPVYTTLPFGVTTQVCTNAQFDSADRDGNKVSEHRYLRMNLPFAQQVTFTMTANPVPSTPSPGFDCTADPDDPENREHSDPDFTVWLNGNFMWFGFSCEPNSEVTTTNGPLPAGEYVIDVNDFRHEDEESPVAYPDRVCFDFTAN